MYRSISGTLETYKAEANGSIQVFVKLYAGTIYSILARIFVLYDYDPSVRGPLQDGLLLFRRANY